MHAKWRKLLDCLERNPHAVGAEKETGTNSIQHQATTHSSPWSAAVCNTFHSVIYTLVGSHRPDVHEMDHAGVLDSKLNGYLCRSALWSLLMTSRWPSSIFKSLFVHKGSWGNEVFVIGINEISPSRLEGATHREDISEEVSWTPRPTVCGETLRIPLEDLEMRGKLFTH